MKKAVLLIGVVLAAALILAEEKSEITVIKTSRSVSGVTVVTAQAGKTNFELQCNEDAPYCTALKAGSYQMVRLPKNHGLYDCTDVEVYPKTSSGDAGAKIGEYCLIEQK